MIIHTCLAILLLGLPRTSYEVSQGEYRVRLEVRQFDSRRYKKSDFKMDKGTPYLKGVEVWGYEPSFTYSNPLLPNVLRTELSGLRVWYKKRELTIPKRLLGGCFNIHLDFNPAERISLSVVKSGIDIRVAGADGAAGYDVTFHIRNNGRHWRKFRALA